MVSSPFRRPIDERIDSGTIFGMGKQIHDQAEPDVVLERQAQHDVTHQLSFTKSLVNFIGHIRDLVELPVEVARFALDDEVVADQLEVVAHLRVDAGVLDPDRTPRFGLHELQAADGLDLSAFDRIVIGASIRYGKHNELVYDFIKRNQSILQSKRDQLPEQLDLQVELPQDHENIRGPHNFH